MPLCVLAEQHANAARRARFCRAGGRAVPPAVVGAL